MIDRLDQTFVRAQIEALRVAYPHIADDEDDWLLTLESQTDLIEVLSAAVNQMQDKKAKISGIGQLISDLKVRQDRFDQRCEAIRAFALRLMSAADVRKLELPQATLSIRAGSPKVIITDEAALPRDCIRVRTEPNKLVIKDRLARGEPISGAEMSNAEDVLAVRVK